MSTDEAEALYTSIHRFAQKHVANCTLEQVKSVAREFHDSNATRLDYALKIHWQLVEDRISSHPVKNFLDKLEDLTLKAKVEVQQAEADIKNYWTK